MKPIFLLINGLLLLCLAYFGVQIFYKHIVADTAIVNHPPQNDTQIVKKIKGLDENTFKDQYDTIRDRNLFKVMVEGKTALPDNQNLLVNTADNLKSTDLDLTLLGTVTGTIQAYAVIEDNKNKLQSLYQIGDKLQGATLKEILRDRVILSYNNQNYILGIDSKQTPEMPSVKDDTIIKDKEIIVNKSLIDSSLKNIDDLKRQIRFRPLVKNGKSDGLLLYSIKQDSVFHTMGLQSGDIIRQVNGSPAMSVQDALEIYQNLKNESRIKVSILRKGKKHELLYHINSDEKSN